MESPPLEEQEPSPLPNYLSEFALNLQSLRPSKSRAEVPPTTPRSEFMFNFKIQSLPTEFPNIDDLEVPYIREIGVKSCINYLGEFFKVKDYNHNLLHFWFLDIVTDCLWRSQDEFRFPQHIQKRILEWVLYLFNFIKDPMINFSRKKFFKAFTEIILIVGEIIDEEQDEIPPPEKVFRFITEEERKNEKEKDTSIKEEEGGEEESKKEDEGKSWSTFQGSKSSDTFDFLRNKIQDTRSFIEIHKEDGVNTEASCYSLPSKTSSFNNYTNIISSSFTITTEGSPTETRGNLSTDTNTNATPQRFIDEPEKSSISLVCPDTGIKAKKIPSEVLEEEPLMEEKYDARNIDYDVLTIEDEYDVVTESDFSKTPKEEDFCPSKVFKSDSTENVPEPVKTNNALNVMTDDDMDEEEILKGLIFQKLWEQRLADMNDSEKGWVPSATDGDATVETLEEEDEEQFGDPNQWFQFMRERAHEFNEGYKKKLLNFAVLWAIIDFVFHYFYNKFQFTLIKLAFQATPIIITQRLNRVWRTPKINKEEAIIPKDFVKVEKKEKKEKRKEEKGKNDKDKKGKNAKQEKEKPQKDKQVKEKEPKLSKEQLKELERQRKEQEKLEEERLAMLEAQLEQNKFMFPLKDGGTDEFFMEIFKDWVKVDLDQALGKGKKEGKEKKGKK